MARFKPRSTAYIVESNRFIREVEIKNFSGGMYLLIFKDTGGGVKLRENRLFATKEEAEASKRKTGNK